LKTSLVLMVLLHSQVVGGDNCPIVDTYWQTETGAHLLAPLPGVWPAKPGSATLPFFGVQPAMVNEQVLFCGVSLWRVHVKTSLTHTLAVHILSILSMAAHRLNCCETAPGELLRLLLSPSVLLQQHKSCCALVALLQAGHH